LRNAFNAMLNDDAFKADYAKTTQTLDPRDWQDAARVIRATVETPPSVIQYAQGLSGGLGGD
jgi:hypothetical protein